MLTVGENAPPPEAAVTGVVDSGASRTLLPMSIARQLEIAHLLTLDAVPGSGVTGETFPTWSYDGVIDAQIVFENPDPELWPDGRFTIRPGFANPIKVDAEGKPVEITPLLGRADFFAKFLVAVDEVERAIEIEPR
jgi:hypothetical protein